MPAHLVTAELEAIRSHLNNLFDYLATLPALSLAGAEKDIRGLYECVERLSSQAEGSEESPDQPIGTETFFSDVNMLRQRALSLQQQIAWASSREKLFETTVNNLPVSMAVVIGSDLVYRFCNPAHRALMPQPDVDPVGQPVEVVWQPNEQYREPVDAVRQVMLTGIPVSGDAFQIDTRVGRRYFSYYIERFSWDEDMAVLLLAWDQTELVSARTELRQRAAEFEGIFNAISDSVMVFDNEARVVRANPAVQANVGFELKGMNREQIQVALRVTRQDGSPVVLNEMASTRALSGEDADRVPIRYLTPDDHIVEVLSSARPLRDDQGQVIGAVTVWHNVTELQEARQAAELERDRLKTLVESMNDEVWFSDLQGNVVLMNDRAVPNLGLESADEINGPLIEINSDKLQIFNLDGTPRPAEEGPLFYALRGEGRRGQEIILNRRTKEPMYREYITNPIRSGDGQVVGAVAVIRDITEQKHIEIVLAKANDQLKTYSNQVEQVNRRLEEANSYLKDFAFIASHDLQEPLRKVKTFGEFLRKRSGENLDEVGQDYLERMLNATVRMQEMIGGLLSYSRINTQANPFTIVDLNKVAEEVLSDLEIRVEQTRARVVVGSLPEIQCDRLQMHQLLLNLIGNAIKFQKPGNAPQVRVWAEEDSGDNIRLIVEDNGIGFKMEHLDRVFQPFQRLHGRNEYEGTGIGLAICRKIVQRHQGQITATSSPGEGARFIVVLPKGN